MGGNTAGAGKLGDLPDDLDARRPGTHHNEGQAALAFGL
jgi:hypothetical protein